MRFSLYDGCDCDCGDLDPDCDRTPEIVFGCGVDEVCIAGVCGSITTSPTPFPKPALGLRSAPTKGIFRPGVDKSPEPQGPAFWKYI